MSELRLYLLAIGIIILLMIYFFGRKRRVDSSHDVFADSVKDQPADALIPSRKVPSMENPGLFTGKSKTNSAETLTEARVEPKLDDWNDPTEETEALPEPVELTDRLHEHEFVTDDADITDEPELSSEPLITAQESAATTKTEPKSTEPKVAKASPPGQIIVMYVVAKPAKKIHGGQALKAFHAHKLRFGDMDIYHRQTGSGDNVKTLFSIASMLKPGTLIPRELSNQRLQGLSLFMKTEGLGDPRGAYDDMVHVAQQLAYTLDAEVKDSALTDLTHDKIADQRTRLASLV
jgi:cell division protein ZipA